MANEIPTAVKTADINLWKCALKGAQLHSVKPVMAYWCYYWTVNQILAKQLHTADEEVLNYTTALMDKLEQIKTENATEEAITDDMAGQAYVEEFAQDTLDRAERVIRANKVTQQTATTFDAAATFFHLVNIWGPADPETQQKIKYAKWNAARIAKAIKEGRDPNESNPKHDEPQEPADVGMLSPSGTMPHAATVEDAPDADLARDSAGVSLPHTPAAVDDELQLPGVPSKLGEPAPRQTQYSGSAGMPSPISPPAHNPVTYQPPAPGLPTAPSDWVPTPEPPSDHVFPPPSRPQSAWQQQPHQQPAPPTFATSPAPTAAVAPPPMVRPPSMDFMNMAPSAHLARPAVPTPSAPAPYVPTPSHAAAPVPLATGSVTADEAAMAGAQKHARWAISALNFDDVPTAVRELRKALEMLGAT